MGRKVALVSTTLFIVLGATLGTAAHGHHDSAKGLFWFLTFARGITGIVRAVEIVRSRYSFSSQGVGGEYPASSTSASEAANEQMLSKRGPGRLLVSIVIFAIDQVVRIIQQFSSWPQTSFFP
jgi:MFS family permease